MLDGQWSSCAPQTSCMPMQDNKNGNVFFPFFPQVRSTTLDTWLPEQVEFMARTGNAVANAYWEARLADPAAKPAHDSPALDGFATDKYRDRRWVRPSRLAACLSDGFAIRLGTAATGGPSGQKKSITSVLYVCMPVCVFVCLSVQPTRRRLGVTCFSSTVSGL
jgi:Putative GTPase activating protein for Arf